MARLPRRRPGSAAASRSTWASARRRRCSPTCSPARATGPTLVIAPPAVVGNWAAEAARFTPELRVVVHHGANRAVGRRDRGRGRPTPTSSSPPTAPRCATSTRIADVAWTQVVLDEAQAIKNPASDTAQQLRRIPARTRVALTGTPIENGLGDLWAILDFTNPGLVGPRPQFIAQLSQRRRSGARRAEDALRALNGILVFRRTKAEPEIAAELPDQIDELDHCAMTPEQIGLYQAVLDTLVVAADAARRRASRARARSSPRSPRSSRSATTRRRTRTTTARSPGARASSPASRRSSTRCSRPASASSSSRTSPSGACSSPTTSPSVTGTPVACYHGGLSRTRPRPDDRATSRPARAPARSCCR